MKLVSAAIAVIVGLCSLAPGTQAQSTGVQFGQGQAPATLEDLWNQADLVVNGHVASTTTPAVINDIKEVSKVVGRFSTVSITEVFKADPKAQASSSIRVLQVGGTARVDGKTYSTSETEPSLDSLHDVILFLDRVPKHSAYELESGDAGMFAFAGDKASEIKLSASARKMPGLSASSVRAADFIARLRSLRSKR